MVIRKATAKDIDAVEKLYDAIHTAEEKGKQTIGWIRGIYPVRKTAEMALARDDLFVLEDDGKIRGTGILNKIQVDSYADGHWEHIVPDEQVCVLHTLVIDPDRAGKGYGRAFIEYYETYARENGCTELRIDTNARNAAARTMYKKHGYTEIGIVPTVFNGIEGVQLVLLEKYLGKGGKKEYPNHTLRPEHKVSLLMDHTSRPGDVADPWYTGDFEAAWQDVMEGCTALLEELRSEL